MKALTGVIYPQADRCNSEQTKSIKTVLTSEISTSHTYYLTGGQYHKCDDKSN